MLINRTANNEAANLNEFSSYYSLGIMNRNSGSYLMFGGGSSNSKIQATDGAGSATAKILSLNPYGGNVTIAGNTAWHAGNDGPGSGLNADLLDSLSSEDFARVGNYVTTFGGTPSASNIVRFDNASGQNMNSATSYLSRLECRQGTAGSDAFMSLSLIHI